VSEEWYLNAVHFTSADEGWAVGRDYGNATAGNATAVLLHYHNGSWTSVTPPAFDGEWILTAVHFTSADEGWAVGGTGLLHYHNGSWTSVTPPAVSGEWFLTAVHFTSAGEGWAVGQNNNVYAGVLLHQDASAALTVDKFGNGTGRVTSNPAGINCGDDCSETFAYGSLVTITAQADIGSTFTGWSGGCPGTDPECVLTMDGDITVTATFCLPPQLSVSEGSIGTQLTITGSDFGAKQGKVLIGGAPIKIAKGAWTPDSITGVINKPLPPGIPYDVILQLKEPKGAAPIPLTGAFTMMAPEITSVEPKSGSAPAEILISGSYFGTKKGKVYLEYEQSGKLKKKNCKVKTWGVDSIIFFVPKTSKNFPAKEYTLKVINKVGEDSETFTVE
jgi:hypothetical protein